MNETKLFCMENPFLKVRAVKYIDIIDFYQDAINDLQPDQKLTISYAFRESLLIKAKITKQQDTNEVGDINVTNLNGEIKVYLFDYEQTMTPNENTLGTEVIPNQIISQADGGHFWILSQAEWDNKYFLASKQKPNETNLKYSFCYQKTNEVGIPTIYETLVDESFITTPANLQSQNTLLLQNQNSQFQCNKWSFDRTFIYGATEAEMKQNLLNIATAALENLYANNNELDVKKTDKEEIELIWKSFNLKFELSQVSKAQEENESEEFAFA